jgi:hypothetical protein
MPAGVANAARARSCHLHQLDRSRTSRVCSALVMRAPLSERSADLSPQT